VQRQETVDGPCSALQRRRRRSRNLRTACQSAVQQRRYDGLFAPTTAGACGAAAREPETSGFGFTAGDEGVGICEQPVRVLFNPAVCDRFRQGMGRRLGPQQRRREGQSAWEWAMTESVSEIAQAW
jgi:hypothetical protein